MRHPGYLDALFAAPHMHEDDKKALPLSFMWITDPDGNVTHENVPGILTVAISGADHRRAIAATIEIE